VPLSPPFPTFPKSHANKMQKQTPLAIHPHTHFPGVKPSHTHLPSFPAFLTAFPPPVRSRHSYLGNAFPDRTNTRPNPKPPHTRVRSLLMPGGKARPRKLSKDKGSILRVWRAALFPTHLGYGDLQSHLMESLLLFMILSKSSPLELSTYRAVSKDLFE